MKVLVGVQKVKGQNQGISLEGNSQMFILTHDMSTTT